MAAKMWSAATMDGREVFADEVAEGSSLRCKYCGAGVCYVPPHARENRGNTYGVRGYFRLLPKSAHEEGCEFNVREQLEVIARRSLGLVQALERGQYRFRLLAIGDMRDLKVYQAQSTGGQAVNSSSVRGALFSCDPRRLLSAYLNTAKRIILLRALCGDDFILKDRLEFVFNGMSVSWHEFYYEEERFTAAYRWLGQATLPFPIALVGRVSAIETIKGRGRLLYVLKFKTSTARPYARDQTVGEVIQAAVWTSQLEWVKSLKENDEVLVFGHWRHATAHTHTRLAKRGDACFRKYLERRMAIWLHVKSQVSRIYRGNGRRTERLLRS
ncbi:hypothetical protein [Caballeronia humi]|uniref:Uncharacterized protein n=1 Tax=Caballeronia humi TaxID=326474 RepID=A0A158IS09_9BURK|nr:hypothetical protein [Caballeronia humi]SAL58959.1 hypothetical protein AWB65_05256 [Caballeronia humi]